MSEVPSWEGMRAPPATQDLEIAKLYARAFRGKDGEKLLDHLRRLSRVGIALPPNTDDRELRFVEGQRSIVILIHGLIERGRNG